MSYPNPGGSRPPRGWTQEQENQHYGIYRADKIAAGEEPRSQDDWREQVRFWAELERRGNHFRDIAWDQLGYVETPYCKRERYQRTRLGKRYQDIGDRSELTAWEFKSGGGLRDDGLMQLDKDAELLDLDWTIIWVVRDGSMVDRRVRERAQELARENDDFYYVDLADEQSIEDFGRDRPREAEALRRTADRFDREEAELGEQQREAVRAELERQQAIRAQLERQQALRAELEREEAARAESPAAAEAIRLNRGTSIKPHQRAAQPSSRDEADPAELKREEIARAESPETAQAIRLNRPTSPKTSTVPVPHLDQESARTTQSAEAAVRQQRAHGNLINGPALNRVQGISHRGPGRGDLGEGMGRGR